MSHEQSTPPSADLLRQWRHGDEAAAEAIFARYAERLTRLAKSRLSARLAARVDPEDIVMSAYRSFFVAARQGRFDVERGGDLWRLLVEVTLHKLCRQAARHQTQRRSIEREQHLADRTDVPIAIAGDEPTPDEALAAAEELEAVLRQLPVRGRRALELRLQGFEHEEIAERLDCTERTVRRRLSEARRIMAARAGGGFVPSAARARPATVPSSPAKPDPGARPEIDNPLPWSDFLLREQIGVGATGKVYRAVDNRRGSEVAIKFLKKSLTREPRVIERFLREALTVSKLRHPHIVPVSGAGYTPGGGYFLVMDLVRGADLDKVRRHGPVAPLQVAAWMAEAARTIQHAHEHGVIHCDLKPGNLLLDDRGSIRVTDFGLAVRLADSQRGDALLAGTPAFMAPEQVDACWGPISPRTDVWGLGSVLYFMLCGQPPHSGANIAEVLARVVAGTPVVFPSQLSQPLLGVARRCLAKQPGERFGSAQEVAEALDACRSDT